MKSIDQDIDQIFNQSRNIAIIGLSDDPSKASHQVALYLKSAGFKIYPVNPKYSHVLGKVCYPGLNKIPEPIDIVDIFRPAEFIPPIVEDAIEIQAKVIWMQLGIQNKEAAQRALQAGLKVVMNRCIKIEHTRRY